MEVLCILNYAFVSIHSYHNKKNIVRKMFNIFEYSIRLFPSYVKKQYILSNNIAYFSILFQPAKHLFKILCISYNVFAYFNLFQETIHFEQHRRIFSNLISSSKIFWWKYLMFLYCICFFQSYFKNNTFWATKTHIFSFYFNKQNILMKIVCI